MTKVKSMNTENSKDNQNISETKEQEQTAEMNEGTELKSNTKIYKTKKQPTAEEVKAKYDKPFFGGGINISSMSSSTGAIKKAKLSFTADKRKTGKKVTTLLRETVQKAIRNENTETSVPSNVGNTSKIKILDDRQVNRSPSPEKMDEEAAEGTTIPSPTRLLNKRASISPDAVQDEFIAPRKTIPLSSIIHKKAKNTLELQNRYDSLSDSSENEDLGETRMEAAITKTTKFIKKVKMQTPSQRPDGNTKTIKTEPNPPPIVIEGLISDLRKLHENISQKCKLTNTLNIKYTKNNTLLFVKTKNDYEKILQYCKEEDGVSFHTYTPSSEKTHAFVVRGLDNRPEPEDIMAAFQTEYDIELVNVYEMHTKGRPLYLIVMSSAITLRYLQQNVRYLMCVRIFLEERENKKRIIQCHRCQVWGHATSNCYRPPKCVKCGEGHFTRECEKPRELPAKCANCGGAHPASAVSCPIYKFRIGELNSETKKTQSKKYEPAPRPATNVWQTTNNNNVLNKGVATQGGKEGFPSLPRRNSINESQTNVNSVRNEDIAIGDIKDSQSLIAELDSLINIKEVNRAIRDLINALRESNSARGRFEIYYGFMQNLESSYNLI